MSEPSTQITLASEVLEVEWQPSPWQRDLLPKCSTWTLVDDDRRFGLAAGDVLLCVPYWLDRGKLTVVARLSDGRDPECNVYRSQVQRVRSR